MPSLIEHAKSLVTTGKLAQPLKRFWLRALDRAQSNKTKGRGTF